MDKVSILVAVYNASEYLNKCLDSLINQTYKDIQIICIDDASTDNSLKILNDYAKKDSRIEIVSLLKNSGLANVRNVAMKRAQGRYIAYLDADDWYSPDTIEKAVLTFETHPKTDIVLLDLRIVSPDGKYKTYDWHYDKNKINVKPDGSFEVMSGYNAFLCSLNWGIHGVYVAKAVLYYKYPNDTTRRNFIDDNVTTRLQLLDSQEVRCCDGKYFYLQHQSSISHKVDVGRMDWMFAMSLLKRKLIEKAITKEVIDKIEWQRWKVIVDCYWFYFKNRKSFNSKQQTYCLTEIKKAWASIEMPRLMSYPIYKLGWYPFKGHWSLFRIEEECYFFIRRLLKRG